MFKKLTIIIACIMALTLFSSSVVFAQARKIIAHDGYLVIECRESGICPMIDNMSTSRSWLTITGSNVVRQQQGSLFRSHGHITATILHTWATFGASAQMWSGSSRINRAEPTWVPCGETAVSTSPWTTIAGTPRILADSHSDFD